jgi:hypothetical protein
MLSIKKIVEITFKVSITILMLLASIVIYQCRNTPHNFLIKHLPDGSRIQNVHIEKLSLNGDYLVVAKIHITEKEFLEFLRVLKLQSNSCEKPHLLFNDFPFEWWVAPETADEIFYKSGKDFEMWSFYKSGYAYYCDVGW